MPSAPISIIKRNVAAVERGRMKEESAITRLEKSLPRREGRPWGPPTSRICVYLLDSFRFDE